MRSAEHGAGRKTIWITSASQGFECLALSLRGHGESKSHKPLDQLSLKDYQKDLFSVIDQFEEPPMVIGHSMGAYLLQQVQQSEKSMVPCSWLPRLPLECCLFFLNFTFRIRFGFTNGVGEPG